MNGIHHFKTFHLLLRRRICKARANIILTNVCGECGMNKWSLLQTGTYRSFLGVINIHMTTGQPAITQGRTVGAITSCGK